MRMEELRLRWEVAVGEGRETGLVDVVEGAAASVFLGSEGWLVSV